MSTPTSVTAYVASHITTNGQGQITAAVMRPTLYEIISLIDNAGAIKLPVKAATTAPITLSGPQTIDGVSVVANDRVLVKDQASAVNNGIYTVKAGAWTRPVDFDANASVIDGSLVLVLEGTTNALTGWAQTTANPVAGTTALTWTQVFGGGSDFDLYSALRDFVQRDEAFPTGPWNIHMATADTTGSGVESGDFQIATGNSALGESAGGIRVVGGDATTGTGSTIEVLSGGGVDGGRLDLFSGVSTGALGTGGAVRIRGGGAVNDGGQIELTAGNADNGAGGSISVTSGTGGTDGGSIFITTETGGVSGSSGDLDLRTSSGYGTGDITLRVGTASGGTAGDISMDAGDGNAGANGGAIYGNAGNGAVGGNVEFYGGSGNTTTGGEIYLAAGPGNTVGGSIYVTAGDGAGGNGGDIQLAGGTNSGGRHGLVIISLATLPTSDPSVPGALYRDGSNFIKVSV